MNIRHTFRYIKKVIKKFFTIAISVVLSFSLMLQAPFIAFADTTNSRADESLKNVETPEVESSKQLLKPVS